MAELDFIEIGLSAALKELSEDKDGKISLAEIKKAYENRGRKFTAEDQKIFEKLDKDDSEKIDIEGKIGINISLLLLICVFSEFCQIKQEGPEGKKKKGKKEKRKGSADKN